MASSRPDLFRGFRTSLSAARTGLSWLRERTGAIITTLLALNGVVLVATGIPLIWRYEPAGSSVLQQLHESAGYILVIMTVVLATRALYARLSRRRSHLGWVAGAGLAVGALAAGTTGVAIAWDEIHTPSHAIFGDFSTGETHTVARPPEMMEPGVPVTPPEQDTGITAATQDGVVTIVSDGAPTPQDEYLILSQAHLLIFPVLIAATYVGGRVLHLRRQRADTADRGEDRESAAGGGDGDDSDPDDSDGNVATKGREKRGKKSGTDKVTDSKHRPAARTATRTEVSTTPSTHEDDSCAEEPTS